jgi:hypothetical protein
MTGKAWIWGAFAAGALVVVVVVSAVGHNATPSAEGGLTTTPNGATADPSLPSGADAAQAAQAELRMLPSTALEVPCSLDQATMPPYTRFSGFSVGRWILADGRCFVDPKAAPSFAFEAVP